MFCPKCKSLLMPKKVNEKTVFACSCGYTSKDNQKMSIKENVKEGRKLEVVDKEIETLPITKEECPKCGNGKAYYWLIQTRSGDESETKFLRCTKCKHTWRDYS